MNVYVEVRSVYLLNRFLMIKTYLNKNQMSDFSVLLQKQGVDSFFENVYIFLFYIRGSHVNDSIEVNVHVWMCKRTCKMTYFVTKNDILLIACPS